MVQKRKLASVIVCYFPNTFEMKELIKTLMEESGLVILINNGGLDVYSKELLLLFPKLLIVNPGTNVGVAAALNLAFNVAKISGFSHVISFDQDSIIDNKTLNALITDFNVIKAAGEKIAAIGPNFYDPRKSKNNKEYNAPEFSNSRIQETTSRPYIITSGCLASVEAWSATNGFDESLFIDLVDVDWCWRLGFHGYKVYMSAEGAMSHQLSDGLKVFSKYFIFNTYSPVRRYYMARNSIYLIFSRKWNFSQKKHLLKSFLFSAIAAIFSDNKKIASIKFIFIGVIHAILGRMGAYPRND